MAVQLLADIEQVGDASDKRDGRWRLNAGSEMVVTVPTLNCDADGNPQPVRIVLDVAGAKFAGSSIVALDNHDKKGEGIKAVVGRWDNASFTGAVEADLHVTDAKTEAEALALAEAVRLKAHIRNKVPIQASVGAEPGPGGSWELVPQGTEIELNGRKYSGSIGFGDLPLYVLRGGLITESSVVVFGADSETGRVAATRSPVTETSTMSASLKAVLAKYDQKHHGLIARRVAEGDDEAKIHQAVQAAEMDERDGIIAGLRAELAAAKAKAAKGPDDEDDEDDGEGMKAGENPVTSTERNPGRSNLEPGGSLTASKRSRGSNRAITFGDREGKSPASAEAAKLEAQKAAVTTVHGAMQYLRASGWKAPDGCPRNKEMWELRAAARRAFPQLGDA